MSGVAHPPITDAAPLPGWCRAIGYTCLALFVLTFVPTPIHLQPLWQTALDLLGGAR
jgi:hypothetical protein